MQDNLLSSTKHKFPQTFHFQTKFKMRLTTSATLLLSALLAGQSRAHSWVEQMSVIADNGSYTGVFGYPRGYVVRNDSAMTILSPPNGQGRTKINTNDMVCAPSQTQPNSNVAAWPQLIAMPGNYVAARYLENGHVTRTETLVGASKSQVGKPGSGGLVYIYGTTNTANQKLVDVTKWQSSGSLQDGRLLAVNNYDDGRCYQISDSPAFPQRFETSPDTIPGQKGSQHELWCETNFQIPKDMTAGTLSMYWVWQWPTLQNMDPGLSAGKDEIYTTCSDIKIVTDPAQVAAAKPGTPHPIQDPMPNAVSTYKQRSANVTIPNNPAFYGPSGGASPLSGPSTAGGSKATSAPAPASPPKPSSPPASQTLAAPVTVTVTETVTYTPPAFLSIPSGSGPGRIPMPMGNGGYTPNFPSDSALSSTHRNGRNRRPVATKIMEVVTTVTTDDNVIVTATVYPTTASRPRRPRWVVSGY